jgi:hypothetical protein
MLLSQGGFFILDIKLQNSYEFTTNRGNSTPIIREYQIPKQDISSKFTQKEIPAATYQRCGQIPIFSDKNVFNPLAY